MRSRAPRTRRRFTVWLSQPRSHIQWTLEIALSLLLWYYALAVYPIATYRDPQSGSCHRPRTERHLAILRGQSIDTAGRDGDCRAALHLL